MRTKNPPQANIDMADAIERTSVKITKYGVIVLSVVCPIATLSSSILFVILRGYFRPLALVLALAFGIATIFVWGVLIASSLMDDMPLKFYCRKYHAEYRSPFLLSPIDHEFITFDKHGGEITLRVVLFIPDQWQTDHNIARVKSIIFTETGHGCSLLEAAPSFDELYSMIDRPITEFSEERHIPVLYAKVAAINGKKAGMSTVPELWT